MSFLPFPPPLGGFNIYLFLCMCHTRQSKTDSCSFKLVRKEQISTSLSWFSWAQEGVSFGQVLSLTVALRRTAWWMQELRQQSQPARSKEPPKGRTALLQVLCPVILFNCRGSSWQLQHSNSSPYEEQGVCFSVSVQHAHSCSLSEATQNPAWQWDGKATLSHDNLIAWYESPWKEKCNSGTHTIPTMS